MNSGFRNPMIRGVCILIVLLIFSAGCLHQGGPSPLVTATTGQAQPGADQTPDSTGGAPATAAPVTITSAPTASSLSCTEGQTTCSGHCVILSSDTGNCGACGNTCPSGQACISGRCSAGATGCAEGQTTCSGNCVNTASDPGNCGGCGHSCGSGQNCISGQCASPAQACASGLTNCNGQCVDTRSDINNCGQCNSQCMGTIAGVTTGMVCRDSQCACPVGQANCGQTVYINGMGTQSVNKCTDTSKDSANCGSCGTKCTALQFCSGGICKANTISTIGIQSQVTYFVNIDTQSDPNNCGSLGHACAAGQTCSGGTCHSPSPPGICTGKMCSGVCTNIKTDPKNCGNCGQTCSCGCSNGVCCGKVLAIVPGGGYTYTCAC